MMTKGLIYIVFCIVATIINSTHALQQAKKRRDVDEPFSYANYKMIYENGTHSTNGISAGQVRSRPDCAIKCLLNHTCIAYNIRLNISSLLCDLVDKEQGLSDMTSEEGSNYFELSDIHRCINTSVCLARGGNLTWADALYKCGRFDSRYALARIDSQQQNDELTSEASNSAAFFKGPSFFIAAWGANGTDLSTFHWNRTGHALNYTNWMSGNSSVGDPTDNCVSVNTTSGFWKVTNCNQKKLYMCLFDYRYWNKKLTGKWLP